MTFTQTTELETTAEERDRWWPRDEVAPDLAALLRDVDRLVAENARQRALIERLLGQEK